MTKYRVCVRSSNRAGILRGLWQTVYLRYFTGEASPSIWVAPGEVHDYSMHFEDVGVEDEDVRILTGGEGPGG